MWRSGQRDWPNVNTQVIGVVERVDGNDEVAWWTRTEDGWYVSNTKGNRGQLGADEKTRSQGPDWWQHAPRHS